MIKIKFRGKDENNGNYVYGDLCNISSVVSTPSIINEQGNRIFVEPESIAQFIGYDKNGNEIYSDDAIKVYKYNANLEIEGFDTITFAGDYFFLNEIEEKTYEFIELVKE